MCFSRLLIFLHSFNYIQSQGRLRLSCAPSEAAPGSGNKPWESVCGRVNEFRSVFATNTALLSIAVALKSAGPRLEPGHPQDNEAD